MPDRDELFATMDALADALPAGETFLTDAWIHFHQLLKCDFPDLTLDQARAVFERWMNTTARGCRQRTARAVSAGTCFWWSSASCKRSAISCPKGRRSAQRSSKSCGSWAPNSASFIGRTGRRWPRQAGSPTHPEGGLGLPGRVPRASVLRSRRRRICRSTRPPPTSTIAGSRRPPAVYGVPSRFYALGVSSGWPEPLGPGKLFRSRSGGSFVRRDDRSAGRGPRVWNLASRSRDRYKTYVRLKGTVDDDGKNRAQ